MSTSDHDPHSLTGRLLIAMPSMPDPRFARSVIFVCAHSEQGAMGLVVNQTSDSLTFEGIVEQLGIGPVPPDLGIPVHLGGPVENSRGFVLHSADYRPEATLVIDEDFALSATLDILRSIASGQGPRDCVFALGYAGWAPGQLDGEIQANGWLVAPPDRRIVFSPDNETKWERALKTIGVDPALLSTAAGHA